MQSPLNDHSNIKPVPCCTSALTVSRLLGADIRVLSGDGVLVPSLECTAQYDGHCPRSKLYVERDPHAAGEMQFYIHEDDLASFTHYMAMYQHKELN